MRPHLVAGQLQRIATINELQCIATFRRIAHRVEVAVYCLILCGAFLAK